MRAGKCGTRHTGPAHAAGAGALGFSCGGSASRAQPTSAEQAAASSARCTLFRPGVAASNIAFEDLSNIPVGPGKLLANPQPSSAQPAPAIFQPLPQAGAQRLVGHVENLLNGIQ